MCCIFLVTESTVDPQDRDVIISKAAEFNLFYVNEDIQDITKTQLALSD